MYNCTWSDVCQNGYKKDTKSKSLSECTVMFKASKSYKLKLAYTFEISAATIVGIS